MGCNASRLDGLPAVALCRDRCNFLDEALRQSYAVADAHVAHMESLKTLGPALHCFFHHFELSDSEDHRHKPSHAQMKPPLHHSSSSSSSSTRSDSSSHNNLVHSDSSEEAEEDTDTDKELSQFFNQTRYDSSPPPATSDHNNAANFMNYTLQPALYRAPSPPPPPPPASSAWDFLNFFETFDKYQPPYSPNRDNTDQLKEKEEKKKKKKKKKKEKKTTRNSTHDHINHNDKGDNGKGEAKKKKKDDSKEKGSSAGSLKKHEPLGSSAGEGGLSEAMKEIQILFERASDSGKPILEMLDVGKLRYHRNIAVNPVPCKLKHVFTCPSKPLTVNCMESSLAGRRMGSGVEMDKGLTYGNFCSTLHKLCMWEKKLYDEVKAEEKLRMLHEKKCRQLRRMNKMGTDAQKVDSVEAIIGVLATKMKISFQVVDKISNTICELREEELWPQINSFIFRFLRMWKDMLECYRSQYKEIAEAKSFDASWFNRKLSNSHLDAAIKLKSEMQNWNLSFSDWIYAQKSHVKALNGWLVRCLMHDPEEIADDCSATFSPGRIGAPPVFVICTKWSRAMDNLSEKDVIEAVNGLIRRVNELLQKHISELQQKLTLDKELERQMKILERQEQKMHKVVQARERKMCSTDAQLRGDAVHHGEVVGTDGLQSGLQHVFAAMERFTAATAAAYEELCQQIEQDNHVSG